MRILNPVFDFNRFLKDIRISSRKALLLDYDGTLAPFKLKREEAFPYPGVCDILNAILDSHHTRLILISGRWTKDLIPLLGLKRIPEIWGSHGWERLSPDGKYKMPLSGEQTPSGLTKIYGCLKDMGYASHCEEKPASIALHLRGLRSTVVKEIRKKISEHWSTLRLETELELHEFDGGIEFRLRGRNKGCAVKTILSEMGEGAVIAYMGDDLTDEDAFKAIKGKGVGVLVRKRLRPTEADMWIKPPEELLEFLSHWQ